MISLVLANLKGSPGIFFILPHNRMVNLLTSFIAPQPDTPKIQATDILNFDQCKICRFKAVDPCALPCGHSICRGCIQPKATVCPVIGCGVSLGKPPDKLPPNFVASQFFDPKPDTPKPMCQICTQVEATHWCEACSMTSPYQFFCSTCDTTEHLNSRLLQSHTRLPVDEPKYYTCPTHKLPQDWFCSDDNTFICRDCRGTTHHNTISAAVQLKSIQDEASAFSDILHPATDRWAKQKTAYIQERDLKQAELVELEKKVTEIKQYIKTLDLELEQIQQDDDRWTLLGKVLYKSIQEYSPREAFEEKKIKILKSRIRKAFHHLAYPTLLPRYDFKFKFGLPGNGVLGPYGLILDEEGHELYCCDYFNHKIQVFKADDGTFVRSIGTEGVGDGQLCKPMAAILDSDNLIVCDAGEPLSR